MNLAGGNILDSDAKFRGVKMQLGAVIVPLRDFKSALAATKFACLNARLRISRVSKGSSSLSIRWQDSTRQGNRVPAAKEC